MSFSFTSLTFVPLAGGEAADTSLSVSFGTLDKEACIDVVVVLQVSGSASSMAVYHAEVYVFARMFGLQVMPVATEDPIIVLRAPISALEQAFGVQLFARRGADGTMCRGYSGCIHIPAFLHHVVSAVIGLDDVPVAQSYVCASRYAQRPMSALSSGYLATQVAELYGFPSHVQGAGQCIGIIALGGGYRLQDLDRYFSRLGLSTPYIADVYLNKARNTPTIPNSHDREIMLDIQVAGAIAPAARLVVYFSQNNDKGFYDALYKAIHDKVHAPGIITISWGAAEKKWARQSLNAYNELFRKAAERGITICAASGDAGSSDGIADGKVHVDFPASSPYVLACGGTYLIAKNGRIVSETVWHESDYAASGGGVSEVFPLPDYQADANVPVSMNISKFRGRGVPDVAGNAAHGTDYQIIVDGVSMVIGGTSAVAPLYAGLIARLNELVGHNLGFINPLLYRNPNLFREIVKGNNITAKPQMGYTAGPGWNACTGLGVIAGCLLNEMSINGAHSATL